MVDGKAVPVYLETETRFACSHWMAFAFVQSAILPCFGGHACLVVFCSYLWRQENSCCWVLVGTWIRMKHQGDEHTSPPGDSAACCAVWRKTFCESCSCCSCWSPVMCHLLVFQWTWWVPSI